jgi:penicillin-binding protein 1C
LIGRDLAAPLFFNIVDALKGRARNDHLWLTHAGLNVKKVSVCALSGQLPGHHCHHQTETWFIPGKSPIATCSIHRELLVSKRTGLRACDDLRDGSTDLAHAAQSADLSRGIFEFWPSDLLQIFRLAGIPRKAPPAYDPSCGVTRTQNTGVAPAITSPKRDVVYSFRVLKGTRASDEQIPFEAVADGDASQLHWFVGKEYLGKADPFRSLMWKPKPGKYIVRVVDDLGRSDSREISVRVTE